MSIVEALRTGRPLRRPGVKHWGSNRSAWLAHAWVMDLLTHTESGSIFGRDHKWRSLIDNRDLLADDWEVKEDV